MTDSQAPSTDKLPSSRQLLRSTVIALAVATVVLVVAVLPAEYGIDPTGIGAWSGLKKMGDIKVSLELESTLQDGAASVASVDQKPSQSDMVEHTLAPGEAVEFKLEMKAGAVAQYKWSTTGGKLNHDTHGDGSRGSGLFISYKKGRMVSSDQGELVAVFDGFHGWYWRNRDSQSVSVTLEVSGDYLALKRMM
ncbi:MAG: transmembrane anchor protein [Gemmatimonadetes bacterium]|nr:transmembrane anchor protein [Gemmatimonadota bacterium]MBT5055892.1 transmembrane anchor protein [Gemmatimonadota bacterium]MBT5141571.1 transmembrane anchor protein [Gemmatimonadota bacterium]MBT5590874.1 transmembrane anchor protein [Gemmatimonadota bacterium]MBT5965062.1 transmembrane anchor protein [Gemmatimonadota bacterium]